MKPDGLEITVATAPGPGAGRFLAAALRDALAGGALLVGVNSHRGPSRSGRTVEFVFDGADTAEVIRAQLEPNGQVVLAEILRRQPVPPAPALLPVADKLLAALGTGGAITRMHWGGDEKQELVVTVESSSDVRLELAEPSVREC